MSKAKTGATKKQSNKNKVKAKVSKEDAQHEESVQVAETASTQEAKSENSQPNSKSQKSANADSQPQSQNNKKGRKKKTNKKDSKISGKKRKSQESEPEVEVKENHKNIGIYDGLGDTAGKAPDDKSNDSDYWGDLGDCNNKRNTKAADKDKEEKEANNDSETRENTKWFQEQGVSNHDESVTGEKKIRYKKKGGDNTDQSGSKSTRYPSKHSIVNKILRMAQANDKRALQRNLEKRANSTQIISITADLEAKKRARLEKILLKRRDDEEKARRVREHREVIEAEKNKKNQIIEEEIQKGRWKIQETGELETAIRKSINNEPTKILEGFNYSFYRPIIESKNFVEDDIVCDVWLEAQGEDDDEIIICELCLSATHQLWYGKELTNGIPNDSWFCERWEEAIASLIPPLEIKWIFWDESKGILTKYTEKESSSRKEVEVRLHDTFDPDDQAEDPLDSDVETDVWFDKKLQKKKDISRWAHVSCINWTPGLYFADDEQYIVEGTVGPERYGHEWYYWKRKNVGTYITWDYDDTCNVHFHARCAMKNGIIGPINSMDNQRDPKNPDNCILFCEKHKDPGIKAIEKLKQQLMIKEMENDNKVETNDGYEN